ncbi:hypothetical protein [Zhongshania aquimaris]|uniref:Uncharacterized protein n=1 Tax=Zhongshania aquimaris TaxID=2857107 RepID=A0ABS6VMH5_9GAMM|nr:hypothetical protein [Zhongshania aquimaris]MBW2939517.1 hypothetical protein [Zhongshania aquimaris]
MKLVKSTLAVASLVVLGASPSHAQLPDLSALTSLGGGLGGLSALPLAGGAGGLPSLDSLPIPTDLAGMGGMAGLPSLDALPGLPEMGGGAGGFDSIPGIGGGLAFIVDGDFLPRLLPDQTQLMQLAGGQAIVTNIIFGAAGEPEAVFSTVNELGVNAGVGAAPILAVLMENPAGVFDFLLGGGTILTPALDGTNGNSAFPGVPFLTQPFSM